MKDSAVTYKDQLQNSEAATRAVLIDPVLRALGWNIANPTKVEVEKPISAGRNPIRVDYALLAEKPVILIEAKKLGEELDTAYLQIVKYAHAFQVESLFLTDGLRWLHYIDIRPGNRNPTRDLNLAVTDLERAAAYFVQELDAALISPEPQKIDEMTAKLEQLEQKVTKLETLERKLPTLEAAIRRTSERPDSVPLIPEAPLPPNPPSGPQWRPLTSLGDVTWQKPTNFRLPNGYDTAVRSWGQVLSEACKFALTVYPNLSMPLPDKAGRSVKLINTVRPPSNINSSVIRWMGKFTT